MSWPRRGAGEPAGARADKTGSVASFLVESGREMIVQDEGAEAAMMARFKGRPFTAEVILRVVRWS
ncbi:protein of unknown function [Rhodovastum atsumiense]|nr:protein of unknown function [Rhodovastum atsumiense]